MFCDYHFCGVTNVFIVSMVKHFLNIPNVESVIKILPKNTNYVFYVNVGF